MVVGNHDGWFQVVEFAKGSHLANVDFPLFTIIVLKNCILFKSCLVVEVIKITIFIEVNY